MTEEDVLQEWKEILAFNTRDLVRYPIRNSEPREQMSGRKWHLIWERDAGNCYICSIFVPKGTGEVDHVIPRSSFAAEALKIADRSDNLRTTCVPCNQLKSNFETRWEVRTVGVADKCWECANPAPFDMDQEPENYSEYRTAHPAPPMTVPAYCGRCGYTWVPDASWLL